MVVGIGTDIVQIDRVKKIYEKYGKDFLIKNFHHEEIQQFLTLLPVQAISYLAKRFAGKEALLKAIGRGIDGGLELKNIAILNNELGAPYIKIFDDTTNILKNKKIHISLSDDYPIAIAFVVVSQ